MFLGLVWFIVGAVVGSALAWAFLRKPGGNGEAQQSAELAALKEELAALRLARDEQIKENGLLSGRLEKSIDVFEQQKINLEARDKEVKELTGALNRAATDNKNFQEKLLEQKKEVEQLHEKFKLEFQNLANEILRKNTREFSDSNQKQIGELLNPFKERIERFEKRVNEVYETESKDRSALMGQVKSLMELNKQISEEANNLTRALKGDTRQQGAWGELILEKILESSGLVKGEEYETQYSEEVEGGRVRPDVVIKLPDQKCIIVDSKVSLQAYDSYCNTEDGPEREIFVKQHLLSIRAHIKSLSDKSYHSKIGFNSPEFVLLFIPIEPGFSLALQRDPALYNMAWDNRIVIVSPTTLLATLRTVASVWKQEKQNKNYQRIAEMAADMYDKFRGFLEDMKKIERGLNMSVQAYQDASGKLHTGRGNLISRAEKFRELGVTPRKNIEEEWIGQSLDE